MVSVLGRLLRISWASHCLAMHLFNWYKWQTKESKHLPGFKMMQPAFIISYITLVCLLADILCHLSSADTHPFYSMIVIVRCIFISCYSSFASPPSEPPYTAVKYIATNSFGLHLHVGKSLAKTKENLKEMVSLDLPIFAYFARLVARFNFYWFRNITTISVSFFKLSFFY